MREIGEQWIEECSDGKMHMYKAVEGPKIVNGLMESNTCHGCCYVDKWDDDCLNPNQACPVGKGVIVKDLGPVNEDGCLAEERTGIFPNISFTCDEWCVEYNEDYISVACFGVTKQQAIDAWNRRAR